MKRKFNIKKYAALTFFILSLIAYSILALPLATCKDCGSLGNCLEGNGFETGYLNCVVGSDINGDYWCIVTQWCGS